MPLREILDTFVISTSFGGQSAQRSEALNYINRAAEAVYESDDLPGSLREQVFDVEPNSQTALPDHVGDLRAMREYETTSKIQLRDMMPRYHFSPWDCMWREWRIKGNRPIAGDLVNTGPLHLTVHDLETPNMVLSIAGSTAFANRVSEDIVLDNTTKQSVNAYTDIIAIQRKVHGIYDVTVLDTNGNQLAILRNNQLKTNYQLVDLSLYPWTYSVADRRLIEVLYKQRLFPLYEDADELPIDDFDTAVAYMACALFYLPQDKQKEKLDMFLSLSSQSLNSKVISKVGYVQKKMQFAPNKLMNIISRRNPYAKYLYPDTRRSL